MDESAFTYPTEKLSLRRRIAKLVTAGDWMARILIESMLVVFSILAALAVNQWQNTKSNEELATQALQAFRREIEQNQARLAIVSPVRAGLRDVLTSMSQSGAFATDEAFYQMIGVEQLRPPFITGTVWETSLTTGAIPHIDFDVVNALSLTYSLQNQLIEFGRSTRPTLARGAAVVDAEMSGAVRELTVYLGELHRNEAELLAAYDQVLAILNDAVPVDSTAQTPPATAAN